MQSNNAQDAKRHLVLHDGSNRAFEIPVRIREALTLLWEAHRFARDCETDEWQFAIELSTLRQLRLTRNDLRWLLSKGLAKAAFEITVRGESERVFRHDVALPFSRRACFILTERGRATAERSVKGNELFSRESFDKLHVRSRQCTPSWDSDRQTLRVGGLLVKQFKVPAANQEAVLAAFQEERWPPRIDDPLPPRGDQNPKRRLHDTINSLNRNQKARAIRFLGDGSGEGVRWEFESDVTNRLPQN